MKKKEVNLEKKKHVKKKNKIYFPTPFNYYLIFTIKFLFNKDRLHETNLSIDLRKIKWESPLILINKPPS